MMDALDISKMADACLRGEAAYCTAACPLGVDVPELVRKLAAEDFRGAFRAYSRQTVFPFILSRLCGGECLKSCPRAGAGGAVNVPLLERACADYGSKGRAAVYSAPRQEKSAAVVGAGLCGLACALTLARKGYRVTVFEKSQKAGGSLWDVSRDILPKDIILKELEKLADEDTLTVQYNVAASPLELEGFDAALVAAGDETLGLSLANDISLETNIPGVFLAGRARLGKNVPACAVVADGLRAARSMERLMKGASLTLGREEPPAPRLNPPAPEPSPAVVPENGEFFTRDEALREAARCTLCECSACKAQCEFLQYYRTDPKTGARDVARSLNAVELLNEKIATRMTNSCADCGLCGELCPENIDMGRICMEAKRVLYGRGELPEAFHDYWLRDMEHSWSEEAFLLLDGGGERDEWLFFPGCQLSASLPENVFAAYEYLKGALDGGVGALLGCCGAPAAWSAHDDALERIHLKIKTLWESRGKPTLILACPSCMKNFAGLREIRTVSLWELLAKNIPQADAGRLAVYDPCAARDFPEAREAVRDIINAISDTPAELPYFGKYARCCGYGGLISTINPELAAKIRRERAAASSLPYVTYCSNCRDSLLREGKTAYHLLELLFPNGKEPRPPRISERRENRRRLKALLSGEKYLPPVSPVKLIISDELLNKMDETLTLLPELERVVSEAENGGLLLLNEENGRFVAHARIGITTFWVEYSCIENEYIVHNFYRHFMSIAGETR